MYNIFHFLITINRLIYVKVLKNGIILRVIGYRNQLMFNVKKDKFAYFHLHRRGEKI